MFASWKPGFVTLAFVFSDPGWTRVTDRYCERAPCEKRLLALKGAFGDLKLFF